MNTHTAYSGKRDPINCPANQPTSYSKCPTCGFATIYKGQRPAQDAPRIVDEHTVIMFRARDALKRLGADKECRLIIEAIDDWMLLQ